MEFYLSARKNEIKTFTGKQTESEMIIVSGVSRLVMTNSMFLLIYEIQI